ncbi:MAG: hypothetical protein ACLT0Y_01890 [Christensenellales bacterium]
MLWKARWPAFKAIRRSRSLHLRDTHYKGAEKLGNGSGYLYPHDFPGHWVKQEYMPLSVREDRYYLPSEMGQERKIAERHRQTNR